MLPLLGWLSVNQSELLENWNTSADGIQFEADILDNSKVDLSLTLPLTERVVVDKDDQGNTTICHPGEPQRVAAFLDPNWIPGAQGNCSEWVLPKMTNRLEALEDWAAGLLGQLEPTSRNKLARDLGQALRRSQQQRIIAQRNPDGSKYAPRKQRNLRGKQRRLKHKAKMFQKIRTANFLKVKGDGNALSVGFTGRIARIARVHQYGLKDKAERGAPDVQYEQRAVLGFTDADIDLIRDEMLTYFTRQT